MREKIKKALRQTATGAGIVGAMYGVKEVSEQTRALRDDPEASVTVSAARDTLLTSEDGATRRVPSYHRLRHGLTEHAETVVEDLPEAATQAFRLVNRRLGQPFQAMEFTDASGLVHRFGAPGGTAGERGLRPKKRSLRIDALLGGLLLSERPGEALAAVVISALQASGQPYALDALPGTAGDTVLADHAGKKAGQMYAAHARPTPEETARDTVDQGAHAMASPGAAPRHTAQGDAPRGFAPDRGQAIDITAYAKYFGVPIEALIAAARATGGTEPQLQNIVERYGALPESASPELHRLVHPQIAGWSDSLAADSAAGRYPR